MCLGPNAYISGYEGTPNTGLGGDANRAGGCIEIRSERSLTANLGNLWTINRTTSIVVIIVVLLLFLAVIFAPSTYTSISDASIPDLSEGPK